MGAFVYRVLGEGGLLELVSLSFQNRHRESVVLWLSTPWNKRNKNYSSRARDTRLSRQPIILELPFVCREEESVRVKTASRAAGRKWNQVPAPPKPFKVFVALAGEVPLQWHQAATSEVGGWGGLGGLEGLLGTGLQCLVLFADWHVRAEKDWLRIRGWLTARKREENVTSGMETPGNSIIPCSTSNSSTTEDPGPWKSGKQVIVWLKAESLPCIRREMGILETRLSKQEGKGSVMPF